MTSCCKGCKSKICSSYYIKNKERVKRATNSYYHNNKDKRNSWEKKKLTEDSLFKIKKTLRHRLRCALYRFEMKDETGSAIKDLGCSTQDLKAYLESKFLPGMTWDNWSIRGWHIDHIVPLSSAGTKEELIKLCHYTNLQPLWWKDNISKGSKVE